MPLTRLLASRARKNRRFGDFVTNVTRMAFPDNVIVLEYGIDSKPRWQDTPHPQLYGIINAGRSAYTHQLRGFLRFTNDLARIPTRAGSTDSSEPSWVNGWLPAMDSVALYSFIALNKPKHYVEVGSGNSTKFARRAIADHHLDTRIISIDPSPRAEIDAICDETIRQPAERVGVEIFDLLGPGDILFIDSSHRALMNSDATALFLDVIPRLKPGVLVQIHDVFIPYDYPANWRDRYYSEQYLLAAYLLAEGPKLEVLMPNTFVSYDEELRGILSPLWQLDTLRGAETFGCSFWMRIASSSTSQSLDGVAKA